MMRYDDLIWRRGKDMEWDGGIQRRWACSRKSRLSFVLLHQEKVPRGVEMKVLPGKFPGYPLVQSGFQLNWCGLRHRSELHATLLVSWYRRVSKRQLFLQVR